MTVFAALRSIGGGAAIAFYPQARWPFLLLPPLLFLRMALNAVDGMLASSLERAPAWDAASSPYG